MRVALAMAACTALAASAQPAPRAFAVPSSGIAFVTGDSWLQDGALVRLYGVQSCLRGSRFTNAAGAALDCGEASLAYLAALVRDARPTCAIVAESPSPRVSWVVCSAEIGEARLDLGQVLITQGFAFAALAPDGRPVHPAYAVAEQLARQKRAGLWTARDLPHPGAALNNAARTARP